MSELPLQHGVAAKRASMMLGATVVAGALTFGVFLLPPAKIEEPSLADARDPVAPKRERRLPSAGIATDWSRVSADIDRFNAPDIEQWKKDEQARKLKEEQDKQVAGGAQPENAAPTGGFAPAWRYLGAVIDGDRRTALVVIPDAGGPARQRFIAEGFQKDEYKVISIEPTRIIVEQGKRRHEVPLAPNERGISLGPNASPPPARFGQPANLTSGAPTTPMRGGVVERSRQRPFPGAPGSGASPPQPGADPVNPSPPESPGID